MGTTGKSDSEQRIILQTITELLTEVKSVKQSLALLTEKVDGLTAYSGNRQADEASSNDVKPVDSKPTSLNPAMNARYDDIDGKHETNRDRSDYKASEESKTEAKQPVTLVISDASSNDVKPFDSKPTSFNPAMNAGYDDIDGKHETNSDKSDNIAQKERKTETKQPVIRETLRPPYTEKRRRRRLTNDTEADCLGKALQENIVILVEDMQFSSSGLSDLLISNDCLTGDECSALYSLNPKDQVRNTIRLIKGRSFEVLKKFLNCVKKFHPEIEAKIWKSYEEKKKTNASERLCVYCKLKRAIDVRYIADFVWSVNGITDDVYAEIVSHTSYNISDELKWERLADACNQSDNPKILKTIIQALERKGYYSHIIPWLRRESKLKCRCSDLSNLTVDLNIPFEVTDDEHSTLSPISSIGDEDFPFFAKVHDIYSSENSVDVDDESRYNAIRVHVSRILSDAGNCMVLTDLMNENDQQKFRTRSHSFGKKENLQHMCVRTQRRASCFS